MARVPGTFLVPPPEMERLKGCRFTSAEPKSHGKARAFSVGECRERWGWLNKERTYHPTVRTAVQIFSTRLNAGHV